MTYVDEHGSSVYGQRIRNLGESKKVPGDETQYTNND